MKELKAIMNKYFRKDGTGIVYYNIDQELFNKVINPNILVPMKDQLYYLYLTIK